MQDNLEMFWMGQRIRAMGDEELRDTIVAIRQCLRETSEVDWKRRCNLAMALTFCAGVGMQRQRERQEGLCM